jgi:MATE family multidrug resistance protein
MDPKLANFQAVISEATKFFPLVAILLLVDCIRLISSGALRGLKDSNLQLIISVCGFWGIAFPGAYLLGFKFGMGGVGIWWGIVIGLFITGMMYLLRLVHVVNKVDLLALVTKK